MTVTGIVHMAELHYLFNVDVAVESLILWPKFQTIDEFVENVCVV